jgi:hypothetical protein
MNFIELTRIVGRQPSTVTINAMCVSRVSAKGDWTLVEMTDGAVFEVTEPYSEVKTKLRQAVNVQVSGSLMR